MQCSVLQSILLTGTDPFLKTVKVEGFLIKKYLHYLHASSIFHYIFSKRANKNHKMQKKKKQISKGIQRITKQCKKMKQETLT